MLKFSKFIQESPYVEKESTKKGFNILSNEITKEIEKRHNNSEKLFETPEGNIHRINLFGMNAYYHHANGKPREYSLISPTHDIQRQISKNSGDSSYIKQIMKHHSKEFGRVRSDDVQSIGGMKFWKNLYHEKDPNYTFYHEENIGTDDKPKYKETPIDDDYMNKFQEKIWNDKNREIGVKHRIVMKPKQ